MVFPEFYEKKKKEVRSEILIFSAVEMEVQFSDIFGLIVEFDCGGGQTKRGLNVASRIFIFNLLFA